MTRFRLWLAELICPDFIILTEEEFDGLFRMAAHRNPDAMFVTDEGDEFEFHLDRSAN